MGISTHILDTSLGRPAPDVPVSLARLEQGEWTSISLPDQRTDSDGRVRHLLPEGVPLVPGFYRARFEVAQHFRAQHLTGLYPYVEITFEVHPWHSEAVPHYHVPLLLSANGYTTYRGS